MSDTPPNADLFGKFLRRLIGRESLEVEYKRGAGGLPKDLWPTVSAFANTNGGWILVGVREQKGRFLLEGLANPYQRLQDFTNLTRNRQKISVPVCGADDASIKEVGGKPILVIRVPAASRKDRPVYVGHNPYEGTYLRRNEGDYRCTKREVDRMMREASDIHADSTILDGYTLDDLDPDALARYRRRYQTEDPGSPWNGYDDLRFLKALGVYRQDRPTGKEGLTVAALLLFGTREALREWRGRHLIDYRRLPDGGTTQERWTDRVTWEGHLFGAFETIYPRLVADLPNPFRLRHGVRRGEGPAHIAIREALVNLLVHADYAEAQASLILRHDQGCRFQNPGNSRVPKHDLFTGDRSDPRNPLLVSAFRYIGLADEAGTGIPKILQAWRELGFNTPEIDVGTERYEFNIRLRYVHLLTDDERTWLSALGITTNEAEQMALISCKDNRSIDNAHLCRLTGLHAADATRVLRGLRNAGLLQSSGTGRGTSYTLTDHAQAVLDGISTEPTPTQPEWPEVRLGDFGSKEGDSGSKAKSSGTKPDDPGTKEGLLPMPKTFPQSDAEWLVLQQVAQPVRRQARATREETEQIVATLCSINPLSLAELAVLLGKGPDRTRQVIRSLQKQGVLEYVYPETPTSRRQRYRVKTPETP